MKGPRVIAFALAGLALAIPTSMALVQADDGSSTEIEIESHVSDRPLRPTAHKLVCTPAQRPANFRLYSLGASFEGMPLTTVLRGCGNPMRVPGNNPKLPPTYRLNAVTYVYGDCEPPAGEGGCATPLAVQVIPACERNVAQYEHRPRITRRRGVPSAEMDRQLELYTADSTVVIFSGVAALARRAARALQPLRRGVAPAALPPKLVDSARLPAPVPGAMTGDLRCDARR
jgi:hypothetical protein